MNKPRPMLARMAREIFRVNPNSPEGRRLLPRIDEELDRILSRVDPGIRARVVYWLERWQARPKPSRWMVPWLREVLGRELLFRYAEKARGIPRGDPPDSGSAPLRRTVLDGLRNLDPERRRNLLDAALREAVHPEDPEAAALLREFEKTLVTEKEYPMPVKFEFEKTGLPESLNDPGAQAGYLEKVNATLKSLGVSEAEYVTRAAVTGWLLLQECFDPKSSDFSAKVKDIYLNHVLKDTQNARGETKSYKDVYLDIAPLIVSVNGHGETVGFREFASVGRFVTARLDSVPLGHAYFGTQVRLGVDEYVAGKAPFESLDLPSLDGELGDTDEIQPENIRAVSMLYAAYNLEQTRMIDVVDRLTELFINGQLAVANDEGGRLLNAYYFEAEDRMNKAARMSQFSLRLGAPGGDVSRESQSNARLSVEFLRVLSSISEYQRQQRASDLFDGIRNDKARALNITQEHVRKACRELAGNLSLYGWGYAHFAAQHVNKHIRKALEILSNLHIQRAYGVDSPWQLVERVSQRDFGMTPNIVKYKTMAESGKAILDILAKHHRAWTSTRGKFLFADPNGSEIQENVDIGRADTRTLFNNVEFWLAVNGIKDAQVTSYSQPEETSAMPSLPNLAGAASPDGTMDQLRSMVSSGVAPSLDQLKALIPSF